MREAIGEGHGLSLVPQGETAWIKHELMWNLSEPKGGTTTGHSASSSGKIRLMDFVKLFFFLNTKTPHFNSVNRYKITFFTRKRLLSNWKSTVPPLYRLIGCVRKSSYFEPRGEKNAVKTQMQLKVVSSEAVLLR